jgi:hypothetical protein
MEISDARDRQADRDRDHLQGVAGALACEAIADRHARRAAWREVAERAAAAKSLPK